jgi:hypothetical protein
MQYGSIDEGVAAAVVRNAHARDERYYVEMQIDK